MRSLCVLFLYGFAAGNPCLLAAFDFEAERPVTEIMESLEFAMNPQTALLVDASGVAHVYYMKADAGIPHIYKQTISEEDAVLPVRVDHGEQGARNPSAVLDTHGNVHVVWNDSRHATLAGHWIDNIEIYYSREDESGFSDRDIRLTNTRADHLGDNGFLPQIAVGGQNRLAVIWYDFHGDGNTSEIYLRRSNPDGAFPEVEGIDAFQITHRDAINQDTSYWVPNLCVLPDESVYVIWGAQRGYSGMYELQGLLIDADGNVGEVETIAEKGGRFFDPPRLVSDQQGNMALAYVVYEDGIYRIKVRYHPFAGEWQESVYVDDGISNAQQPDIVFDEQGSLYITWQDDLYGWDVVYLAEIDPVSMNFLRKSQVSSEDAYVLNPSLSIEPGSGRLHLAWLDKRDGGRRVYYTRQRRVSVSSWPLY